MKKVNAPIGNDYCPQTLFLYGTYKENGEPNFGLFCWFSYCWSDTLGVMACIGGSKLTQDRIKATKVFSANLVTESQLALADYFGTKDGYDEDKMAVPYAWEKGAKLNVPVLSDSPVSFELEVTKEIPMNDQGSTVLLCKVRNVLIDEMLADKSLSLEEKLKKIAPVSTTCATYFGWDGHEIAKWHELAKKQ